ncbi:AAA family ATPase, partial [Candidatus Roizmanbacteria bacterium]|nr:AAA family ATPase [Candidatus Roizmanbacteria bacterium]
VVEQVNFTGTEIDLLCEHLDRPNDRALVECKARTTVNSTDIKNFVYDIIVAERADYGFFAHTSELHHQAAGTVAELKQKEPKRLIFWGPEKIINLLQHCNLISASPNISSTGLTATKQILLYSYRGRFWVTLLSNKIVPTHFHVADATNSEKLINSDIIRWISDLDELQGLSRIESAKPLALTQGLPLLDSVADIQEAIEWDDYRPVGTKYFVGRNDIRRKLFQFVQSPFLSSSGRRVFFVEGKSGWGKSSLLAELRARSRNKRNKNSFFVLALDSRSANTSEFLSLSIAKLIISSAKQGFIPEKFSEINVTSSLDTLASPEMQELFAWLKQQERVLVVIFDQFEDVFRKEDLFRAFHKLMMDAHNQNGSLIVGFSWKSEIHIPIDNKGISSVKCVIS